MKARFTIVLPAIMIIAGCTTAPRETVELSEIVDRQIVEMQVSHEKFVRLYYDKLRDEVDHFLEQRWIPQFLTNVVEGSGESSRQFRADLDSAYKLATVDWEKAIGIDGIEDEDVKNAIRNAIEQLTTREKATLGMVLLNFSRGVQEQIKIKRIHDHGIAVLASFIYGTDFDTRDSLLRLADFIFESTIDATSVKPLTPFPGTRLYERLKQEGRLLDDSYWLEDPYPIFTFQPKKLSLQELAEATLDFLDVYNPLNSAGYFMRSYRLTKSVRASFMAFLVNISDNHTYRKYIRRHKHTLARRFGIDQWRRR